MHAEHAGLEVDVCLYEAERPADAEAGEGEEFEQRPAQARAL